MRGIFRPPSWLNRPWTTSTFTAPGGVSQVHITCIGGGGGRPGQVMQLIPEQPKPPLLSIGEWTKRTTPWWPWSKEETTQVDVNSIKDLRRLIR